MVAHVSGNTDDYKHSRIFTKECATAAGENRCDFRFCPRKEMLLLEISYLNMGLGSSGGVK